MYNDIGTITVTVKKMEALQSVRIEEASPLEREIIGVKDIPEE